VKKKPRSFEVIWAIGTMFGETQRVDMITTRKNKFGRFQIAVLNPSVVPTKMDVVIGARFFELQFEIEPYPHSQGTSQFMGRGDDGGGDNAQVDKEDARNGSFRGNMSMGVTSSAAQPFVSGSDKGKGSGMIEAMSLDDLEDDDLLDEGWEINDACLPSSSLAISSGHHTQLSGEELVKENVVLQPSQDAFVLQVPLTDMGTGGQVVSGQVSAIAGEDLQEGEKCSKVVALVQSDSVLPQQLPLDHNSSSLSLGPLLERALKGVKEKAAANASDNATNLTCTPPPRQPRTKAASTPTRRSKRREGSTDEHSVDRAARMVAKKNLEVAQGNDINPSIPFYNEHMADSIENISISIGNDLKNVQPSVVLNKKVDKDRPVSVPTSSVVEVANSIGNVIAESNINEVANLVGTVDPEYSILSIPNERMADHITSIGISLGNDLQNVQSSVLLIKDMEKGRTVSLAKSGGVESANPGVVEVAELDDSEVEIDRKLLITYVVI
jgi:hypothetical protein